MSKYQWLKKKGLFLAQPTNLPSQLRDPGYDGASALQDTAGGHGRGREPGEWSTGSYRLLLEETLVTSPLTALAPSNYAPTTHPGGKFPVSDMHSTSFDC